MIQLVIRDLLLLFMKKNNLFFLIIPLFFACQPEQGRNVEQKSGLIIIRQLDSIKQDDAGFSG